MSPFHGATDTPVLDFWWRLPWVSKPGWIPRLHALSPMCHEFLRFTSGVTPADCIEVSMVAGHVPYMLVAEVGCWDSIGRPPVSGQIGQIIGWYQQEKIYEKLFDDTLEGSIHFTKTNWTYFLQMTFYRFVHTVTTESLFFPSRMDNIGLYGCVHMETCCDNNDTKNKCRCRRSVNEL